MRGRRKRNILVINGAISLDFALELTTCIYHLKDVMFRELFGWCFYPPPYPHFLPLSQTGADVDHSAVGKYQGHTFPCRRFITSAAVAVALRRSCSPKRGAAEKLLHNLEERDSAQLLCFNRAWWARSARRGRCTATTTLRLGDCGMRGLDARDWRNPT